MTLEELRKERHHIASKISNWKKSGKDISDLLKREEELKEEIRNAKGVQDKPIKQVKPTKQDIPVKNKPAIGEYKVRTISEEEQAQLRRASERENMALTGVLPKSWSKKELDNCCRLMNKILDENDWHEGYKFRSSDWMFVKDIVTRVLPDSVEFSYTIMYCTGNHRVEKSVVKYFNPDTVKTFNKYIEDIETWVMLNSGDMDDKSIIFGNRFNKTQFDLQGLAKQGWVVYNYIPQDVRIKIGLVKKPKKNKHHD